MEIALLIQLALQFLLYPGKEGETGMNLLTERVRKYNGQKLGDIMIELFQANNSHYARTEAEISDYYKCIMLNREGRT